MEGGRHGGDFVEVGEVTSLNRKNMMGVCGGDGIESLGVDLLEAVLHPVAEAVGRRPVVVEEVDRRPVLAVVVEAGPRRRICSYEDGGGLLDGCRGNRGNLAGGLFQAPILACRSRSCQRRMLSRKAAPWVEAGAARAVSRGDPLLWL